MKSYTTKNDWTAYFYDSKPKHIETVVFSDIFQKYLKPDDSKTVLEIGCAGGDFLCYIVKKFKYQAYGVDYSDEIIKTQELFRFNGLFDPVLYKEDFFQWNPELKFDLVCSFGFIEHFDDIREIIKKHVDLTKSGGKIIISLPHFAHAQYLLHYSIDRENLKKHNLKIMNLRALSDACKDLPIKIDYLSYYKTFGFWTERNDMARWEKIVNWGIIKFGKMLTKIFGYDRPNLLFSPHIICVATKT